MLGRQTHQVQGENVVTEIERRATDVLEKLYECHKVDGDSMETVATYLQGEGLDTSYGYTLIDFLDTAGYVTPASTFGGAAGMIHHSRYPSGSTASSRPGRPESTGWEPAYSDAFVAGRPGGKPALRPVPWVIVCWGVAGSSRRG
jgi:hypothetical protein